MTHEGTPRTPEQPLSLEDRVMQLEAHVVAMSEKIDAMNEQTAKILERLDNPEAVKGMGAAAVAAAQEEEAPQPAKIDNEAPIGVRRVNATEAKPAKEEKQKTRGRGTAFAIGALALVGTTAALMFGGGDKSQNTNTDRIASDAPDAPRTANANPMTGSIGNLTDMFKSTLTTEAANADTKDSTKAGDTSTGSSESASIGNATTVASALKNADLQSASERAQILKQHANKTLKLDLNNSENKMNGIPAKGSGINDVLLAAGLASFSDTTEGNQYGKAAINFNSKYDRHVNADTNMTATEQEAFNAKFWTSPESKNYVKQHTGWVYNTYMEDGGKMNQTLEYFNGEDVQVREVKGIGTVMMKVTKDPTDGKICINFVKTAPAPKEVTTTVTPNGKTVIVTNGGGGSGGPRLEVVQQGGGGGGSQVQTETTPSGGGNGGSTVTPGDTPPPPPPPPVKEEKEDDGNPGAGIQTPAETGPGVVTGVEEPVRPVGATPSVIAPPPPAPPSSETTPRPPAVEGPNQGGNGTPVAPVPGTGNAPGQGQGGTVNPNDL